MKKTAVLLLFLILFSSSIFSERYKVVDADYQVQGAGFSFLGATKPSVLRQKFPIDKKKTFDSIEELEKYVHNYEQNLVSSRVFDSVKVEYETSLSDTSSNEEEINEVILKVELVDTHHFLVVPYPKYSSDSGASLKLKARDSNFLGTLNTMNTTISLDLNDKGFIPELSFGFDYPFAIGDVGATFINDYSLSYVIADEEYKRGFEWNTKTGLNLSIPFDKLPLNIGINQYTGANLDYKYYEQDEKSLPFKDNEDYNFFTEELSVGTSVKITEFSNYTTLSYNPSIAIKWNWDKNGINKANDSLSSPILSFSHSLSNGKITWNDNMRKGYNFSLGNSISYNFHRRDLNPNVSFSASYFWNYEANENEYWNRFGICTNLYAFYYIEIPSNAYRKQYDEGIADRLRGVLNKDCGSFPAALIFNIDLPHNVFTTNFKTDFINFNLQVSPFFDMALVYNKEEKRVFNFYDGYYCSGLEFLVYPQRWSSITVRASLGIDLNKAADSYNIFEAISKGKEIFIGIGLHY